MACNVGLEHIKPTPKSLNEIFAQMEEEGANDNGNGVVGIMEVPDFQSRFDKSTAQAKQMMEGAPRVL